MIGTHVRMWWGPQGIERFLSIFPLDGLVVLFVQQLFVYSPFSSSCSSEPPTAVDKDAGQAEREVETATRLRRRCRLKVFLWALLVPPFCDLHLFETQMQL